MGNKGWGAYADNSIPKGVYVADYTGEVLSVTEARRRVPDYDKNGLNYVLTTQEFFQGVRAGCSFACRSVVYVGIYRGKPFFLQKAGCGIIGHAGEPDVKYYPKQL